MKIVVTWRRKKRGREVGSGIMWLKKLLTKLYILSRLIIISTLAS